MQYKSTANIYHSLLKLTNDFLPHKRKESLNYDGRRFFYYHIQDSPLKIFYPSFLSYNVKEHKIVCNIRKLNNV